MTIFLKNLRGGMAPAWLRLCINVSLTDCVVTVVAKIMVEIT